MVGRFASLTILSLVLASAAGAVIVSRISFGADGWLWNLDLPKIHFPLAVFYHDALEAGRLPLWQDDLGLGFPLYAEGQIGAFYPPNWLFFRFEPLVALDLTRLVHLTLAGTGAGLLALRVAGSRQGALLAALIVAMGGAIVTKLEWWNVVAAYAWMPWVLLPLAAGRAPRRSEVVLAGLLWGVQALAGHPNTWLLTGVAALVLLVRRPWPASMVRIAVFGVVGASVGAMQLVPTALLRDVSARAGGLSADDLFLNAATPFDLIGAAFANAFLRASSTEWDYATSWFPDGHFPLLEAGLYVGLPVLALAGIGARARRARRWLLLAAVMALIAIVAAFRPALWADIPLLNGLRAPVRSYMVLAFAIAILAAIGISRLGRSPAGVPLGLAAIAVPVAAYATLAASASFLAPVFDQLVVISSTNIDASTLPAIRNLAIAALTSPWPLLLELTFALAAGLVISRPRTPRLVMAAVILAVTPLGLLLPPANPLRPPNAFSYAEEPFVETLRAQDAHRVLTIGAPGWYAGMPDQLAAAAVPDIGMFSSLNLAAVDAVTRRLREDDSDGSLRRAVGIDLVVTFGSQCPGRIVARVELDDAYVCRVTGATGPPYWIPESAARMMSSDDTGPPHAEIDASAAVAAAVPLDTLARSTVRHEAVVEAPEPGWVFFDRAWWPSWRVTIDGRESPVYEALGGQLISVPAGRHIVVADLTLWEVQLGALVGLLGLAGALVWATWPRFTARAWRAAGAGPAAPRSARPG